MEGSLKQVRVFIPDLLNDSPDLGTRYPDWIEKGEHGRLVITPEGWTAMVPVLAKDLCPRQSATKPTGAILDVLRAARVSKMKLPQVIPLVGEMAQQATLRPSQALLLTWQAVEYFQGVTEGSIRKGTIVEITLKVPQEIIDLARWRKKSSETTEDYLAAILFNVISKS